MQIFAPTLFGRIVTLDVEASDTIGTVRAKIQEADDGIRSSPLYWQGPLHDDHTLSYYNIPAGSLLRGSMQIGVKNRGDGKTIMGNAAPGSRIWGVKMGIYDKEGIHPDRISLIFNDKPMINGLTLSDYSIEDMDVIESMYADIEVIEVIEDMDPLTV